MRRLLSIPPAASGPPRRSPTTASSQPDPKRQASSTIQSGPPCGIWTGEEALHQAGRVVQARRRLPSTAASRGIERCNTPPHLIDSISLPCSSSPTRPTQAKAAARGQEERGRAETDRQRTEARQQALCLSKRAKEAISFDALARRPPCHHRPLDCPFAAAPAASGLLPCHCVPRLARPARARLLFDCVQVGVGAWMYCWGAQSNRRDGGRRSSVHGL